MLRPEPTTVSESRLRLWADEAACAADAAAWSPLPELRNAFVALHGDLGAGKTAFARHLLRALGASGRIKSPTFAVLESYALPWGEVSHFDFYRFERAQEWADAGFRDVFAAPGLKLAEWPQRAHGQLPVADVDLHIRALDDGVREVRAQANSAAGAQLLRAWGLSEQTP